MCSGKSQKEKWRFDAKPVETKEPVDLTDIKREENRAMREEESVGYNPSKKDSTVVTK